jgi:hypothetical protein
VRRRELDVRPLREELEVLVRYSHHLETERENTSPVSSARRHLEDRLERIRERLERLLDEWVPEPELQQAWRDYLDHHASEPDEPHAIAPLLFRGVNEAGSVAEIRRQAGEELRFEVDGSLVERVAAEKDLASDKPGRRIRIDGMEFTETFEVSPEALDALGDFSERGGTPPWEYASELLADGLIDVHFDLTPRGRRALAGR